MSTATYARPLYAVPDVPPSTKARFASLLALRDAACRAFDKALSLPRSAIRWAIDLFHRWVEATGSIGVISWLSARARDAAGLLRTVGILPSALVVLSIPPVAAAALRVAKFAVRGIVSVAKAAWTGIKGLLGRFGNSGMQIGESLRHIGTQVSDLAKAVAHHPVMNPIVNAVRATLALVRPFTQGFVVSRILSALVPVMWVRAVIGLVLIRSWWTPPWPATSGTPCGLHAPTRRTGMAMVCSLTSWLLPCLSPPTGTLRVLISSTTRSRR